LIQTLTEYSFSMSFNQSKKH